MDTIYSLLKRAKELKEKSQVDSITPEEVGKLHEDTLAYIASLEQSADGLGIKKVYQSKSTMEADTNPVGTNGKALRYGQLVSIYDDAHADGSENGNIYAYQKPGWLLMGRVSGGNTILPIVQETGYHEDKIMSQKSITEALNELRQVKVEERTSVNPASLIWNNGGWLKSNGNVFLSEEFICTQLSVIGYSRVEFQYQAYSAILASLICDADGGIIQKFGVEENGAPLTWNTAAVDLPANAAYIKLTGYASVKPSLTLVKKMTVNEKATNLDGKISALKESIKSLFIKDYTNSIRYNTGGINVSDGSFASNGYNTFAVSDFIEIPEGAVRINLGYQGYSKVYGSVIYNSDKKKIAGYSVIVNAAKAGDVYETGYIDIPEGAKYVRITSYQSDKEKKIPLIFLMRSIDVVNHKELKEQLESAGIVSPFKSMRLAFCGDSITYGLNQDGGARLDAFPGQVGRLLGCQTTNYGVSSASVGGTSPRVWSRDYTVVSTEEDIIGVMIGINDFYRDYSLGNKDGSSGFYKDLHTMWKGFISRFPPSAGKRLFCMIYPYYDVKPNWEKWTAAMQEVAEYYSIPILDFSKELGINPHMDINFEYWREEGAQTGNGQGKHNAHPTQLTHDMMAKVVAAYIKSHYEV
nr:SGNH/GDSL hydrolase family protein [uncultured Prevotella sp.]